MNLTELRKKFGIDANLSDAEAVKQLRALDIEVSFNVDGVEPKVEERKRVESVVDNSQKAIKEERARVSQINAIGEKCGIEASEVRSAIESGMDLGAFKDLALDKRHVKDAIASASNAGLIGMDDKSVRDYSLFKAVRANATGNWKGAEFELECSNAVADKQGKEARGFFVPQEVFTRTLLAGTATGNELVATEHKGSAFIDLLRNNTVVGEMGATYMTGLQGNINIPKQSGGSSFYWVAEDGVPTESEPTFTSVAMSPKTLAGQIPVSRLLLKQSDPSVEMIIRRDIIQGMALALDLAAIQGTGASNQPLGLLGQTGLNSVTADVLNAPTYPNIIDMETQVAIDNALRGNPGYIYTPAMNGVLKGTQKFTNGGMGIIENGMCNGYSAKSSSNLTGALGIFGNFQDLIIGSWGGLDIVNDTAKKADSGGLVLRAFHDVDIAVRYAESFCELVNP